MLELTGGQAFCADADCCQHSGRKLLSADKTARKQCVSLWDARFRLDCRSSQTSCARGIVCFALFAKDPALPKQTYRSPAPATQSCTRIWLAPCYCLSIHLLRLKNAANSCSLRECSAQGFQCSCNTLPWQGDGLPGCILCSCISAKQTGHALHCACW